MEPVAVPTPRWLRATVWGIALALALLGVVLAVLSSSWLPLVYIVLGLALPMFPVGSPMTRSRRRRPGPLARKAESRRRTLGR